MPLLLSTSLSFIHSFHVLILTGPSRRVCCCSERQSIYDERQRLPPTPVPRSVCTAFLVLMCEASLYISCHSDVLPLMFVWCVCDMLSLMFVWSAVQVANSHWCLCDVMQVANSHWCLCDMLCSLLTVTDVCVQVANSCWCLCDMLCSLLTVTDVCVLCRLLTVTDVCVMCCAGC